ncbi:Inositol(Myo)-1(Or 4)-monophosphatase [Nesidiocoris tenuis]|uniref:Inositol-1-monophosphatase n=1 Tax=Nesidiocoris tenuis TaxID=355587 RepID=A0ABN7ARF0_9HEMI|nr:Inositol(Myo)-1(Or 4)-monophosphatase [Nesidiocoris tenuis]
MIQVEIDEAYNTLMEAVAKASEIVTTGFEGTKNVEEKSASYDLVTEFDRKTEDFLIATLSKAFPHHKFIGEETTAQIKLTDAPTWIIDPIDGTTNFVHCFPHSAISVALAVNREIVIGVVCNPMLVQTFTAIKGKGAFLNGKPIRASTATELRDAVVGFEISLASKPEYLDKFVKRYRSCVAQAQGMRCLGSAQLSLCMVAQGAWDAYHVEYLYPWDVAAGSLIITEAGGCVMDIDGGEFNCETGRIISAGTKSLAEKLVDVFDV